MSTWNNEQDRPQGGPAESPANITPLENVNAFVTEGSLAVAPEAQSAVAGSFAAPAAGAQSAEKGLFAPHTPGAPESVPAAAPQTSSAPESDAAESDAADIEQNKVFAIVGYLGILFLVPLLAAPNSKFARYHANQGIVLFIASVVLTGAFYILGHIPVLGRVFGFVGYLVWLAVFVLMVLGIVNAANGKCRPLPWLGRFQFLK